MSRSIQTILKRSHFTLALGAAALVATSGCIQPQPIGFEPGGLDDPSGSVDLTGAGSGEEEAALEFAALTFDADGSIEIVILNEAGETVERIDTDYRSAIGAEASEHSLMHHSEDFFLVTSRTEDWQSLILRIDWDGTVSEFARPSVNPMSPASFTTAVSGTIRSWSVAVLVLPLHQPRICCRSLVGGGA